MRKSSKRYCWAELLLAAAVVGGVAAAGEGVTSRTEPLPSSKVVDMGALWQARVAPLTLDFLPDIRRRLGLDFDHRTDERLVLAPMEEPNLLRYSAPHGALDQMVDGRIALAGPIDKNPDHPGNGGVYIRMPVYVADTTEQALADTRSMVSTVGRRPDLRSVWQPAWRDGYVAILRASGRALAEGDIETMRSCQDRLDALAGMVEPGGESPLWPVYGGLLVNLRNILGAGELLAPVREGDLAPDPST